VSYFMDAELVDGEGLSVFLRQNQTHFKVCELTTSERGWSELRPLTLWIVF